jgi:hypothetical protein
LSEVEGEGEGEGKPREVDQQVHLVASHLVLD